MSLYYYLVLTPEYDIIVIRGGIFMGFSSIPLESLSSIKQALSIATMRKSMNQDASTVASLLDGMKQANAKVMEQSVTPHKGGNIDIKL